MVLSKGTYLFLQTTLCWVFSEETLFLTQTRIENNSVIKRIRTISIIHNFVSTKEFPNSLMLIEIRIIYSAVHGLAYFSGSHKTVHKPRL